MKILTINYPITDERVTNRGNLVGAEALFDFDVVIIQPLPISTLITRGTEPTPEGIKIAEYDYSRIKNLWGHRANEIEALLENNGILIVLLAPYECVYSHHYNGQGHAQKCENHWLDNYGWLPINTYPAGITTTGGGNKYQITNNSNPFTEYLKQGDVRWQTYINCPEDWNVFAESVKDKVIGATVNVENGKIVFLPSLQERNDEVLLSCIENSFETYSETPPPDWINEFILPKEKEGEQDIEKIQQQLEEIKEREKKAKDKLEEITKFKKLLYEQGKHQLEPIVRDAFRLFGFTVHDDYKPKTGSNIEIDTVIECNYGQAIVEIKGRGTKKEGEKGKCISLDDFSQLTNKIQDDLKITGKTKEGILVGNGFRLCTHPKNRRGEKIFTPHVKESAERQSITLINTVDLYGVVHGILGGEEIDKDKLQQKILGSKGICEFKEFIKEN